MIPIVLVPAPGRPGVYRAEVEGQGVVCTSRQPFYDAARKLIGLGHDPSEKVEVRHLGSGIVALRSTLGEAARWTVSESDGGGLKRRPWRPFDASGFQRETCDCSDHGVPDFEREAAE